MTLTGEIFLIRWGLFPAPAHTFNIAVGHTVAGKKLKVVAIVREFMEDGTIEWHIECMKFDNGVMSGDPFVWKTYYLKPDEVLYFMPDEKHDYKVV